MRFVDNTRRNVAQRSALLHREILQLGVLILVAVAAFFLTRAVAANNRTMSLRDAAEWSRRGQQQIDAGNVDDAIDDFRRATVRDRNERRYVLSLARALVLKGEHDAAWAALLPLRESFPDDPDINLHLARLAAARQDVTDALRFYHNALYAPWPSDGADARRGIRFELIRFILMHGQTNRALSELLAVTTDLPDEATLHIDVAHLFAEAGDNGHALDQFQRALRLVPDSGDALAGAGYAAFQLGDYSRARAYLRRAPEDAARVKDTRALVDLVISNDPLATRIGSAERRRRLVADFSYAQQRLNTCFGQHTGGPGADDALRLQDEARAFDDQVKPRGRLEQDTVESGVDLIDRIERQVALSCRPPTPLDQALVLIGRRHGADPR